MTSNLYIECTTCHKKLKNYKQYNYHMDACHPELPRYACDKCNKSYKNRKSFKKYSLCHHVNGGGSEGQQMSQYPADFNSQNGMSAAAAASSSNDQDIEHQINQSQNGNSKCADSVATL